MKKMPVTSTTTLQEVHEFNRTNWESGCVCAGCGQIVKLYKRKLNSGIARFLINIYKVTLDGDYAYGLGTLGGIKALDFSVARHWGLIEEDTEEVNGKRQSGYWRITQKGADFVRLDTSVPSHVHLFNNKLAGFSEEHINILDALGEKFDYEELMAQ